MDLCSEKDIKALLGRHGFRFSKSMGQNFLIDGRVPRAIAEASGADEAAGVLEIGPGIGPLTVELAKRAAKVAAVELDRALYPILAETLSPYPNAEVVEGDAMKLDLAALAAEKFPGLTPIACANLPYNITTPAITRLVAANCFAAVTVMIQREVAKRICAAPGTADYGAFSVFCRYHTEPEYLFEVGPECFLPAPKVTSAVVRLVPRREPAQTLAEEGRFFQVVKAAFAQRRKTLLNGLAAAFGSRLSREGLRAALEGAGLDPGVRGERLGIEEFARLTAKLAELGGFS